MEARGVVGGDGIQTFFRNLVGDSQPPDATISYNLYGAL
jgi:hypothetical protein